MNDIKVICIDDSNRPPDFPIKDWIKKNQEYTVKHIYKMVLQNMELGISLFEINLNETHLPYNCFRLKRFAIHRSCLKDFFELCKLTHELNDVSTKELLHLLDDVEKIEQE